MASGLQVLLAQRARLLGCVRAFFGERGVLEVTTPVWSSAGNPDPQIDSVAASLSLPDGRRRGWLRTSPEFFHKRLLAEGAGPIYEIGPVFRDGEVGPQHNPEFLLLEWYRPGFDHLRLIAEVHDLLVRVHASFDRPPPRLERVRYRQALLTASGLDVFALGDDLPAALQRRFPEAPAGLDFDQACDWIRAMRLEPSLPEGVATCLTDFPPSQAALARVRDESPPVASRFEFHLGRVEIANGYHELADVGEQHRRFSADRDRRRRQGRPCPRLDRRLLAALASGLPDCAGVALGLDRLLACLVGARRLAEVLPFPVERA